MPTRPTSTLYQWCTSILNREPPTTDDKKYGFRAGDPVPPLTINDILGTLSEWAQYLQLSLIGNVSNQALAFTPGSLVWREVGGAVTHPALALNGVEVAESGGTAGSAQAAFGPITAGGTIDSVEVTTSGLDNTGAAVKARAIVTVTDASTTSGIYAADIVSDGTHTLPLSTGTAPTTGPITVICSITSGDGTGNTITLDSFAVNFS